MPADIATWPIGSSGSRRPGRSEGRALFRRLLVIALFIEMGLLLAALPWTAFWDHNYFAQTIPWLRIVLTNNFARGAVTGLGLINLYVGLVDLAYLVGDAAQMRAEGKKRSEAQQVRNEE